MRRGSKSGVARTCAIFTRDGVKVKRCSGCEATLPVAAFCKGSGPGGLHRHCKQCLKGARDRKVTLTGQPLQQVQAERLAPSAPKNLSLSPDMPAWLLAAPRCHYFAARTVIE